MGKSVRRHLFVAAVRRGKGGELLLSSLAEGRRSSGEEGGPDVVCPLRWEDAGTPLEFRLNLFPARDEERGKKKESPRSAVLHPSGC